MITEKYEYGIHSSDTSSLEVPIINNYSNYNPMSYCDDKHYE